MANAAEFSRRVEVFLGHLSPQSRSAALAAAARAGLKQLQSEGRVSRQYRTFVDGVEGASEDSVKPEGTITYRFSQLGEIVAYALAELMARTPRGPAKRRGTHMIDEFLVIVNGREIPAAQFAYRSVPDDAKVWISNYAPYNRKVDVQYVGTRQLHFSKGLDMYYDVARAVKRKYGAKNVRVERFYNVKFRGKWILRGGRNRANEVEAPGILIEGLR